MIVHFFRHPHCLFTISFTCLILTQGLDNLKLLKLCTSLKQFKQTRMYDIFSYIQYTQYRVSACTVRITGLQFTKILTAAANSKFICRSKKYQNTSNAPSVKIDLMKKVPFDCTGLVLPSLCSHSHLYEPYQDNQMTEEYGTPHALPDYMVKLVCMRIWRYTYVHPSARIL